MTCSCKAKPTNIPINSNSPIGAECWFQIDYCRKHQLTDELIEALNNIQISCRWSGFTKESARKIAKEVLAKLREKK